MKEGPLKRDLITPAGLARVVAENSEVMCKFRDCGGKLPGKELPEAR